MKIRILRPMVVDRIQRAIGDTVEVKTQLGNYLISIKKAAPVGTKDAGKVSARQTATADKPKTPEGGEAKTGA